MIACFSAVLPAPVDVVWAVARDFGDYRLFTSGRGDAFVEDGRSGDSVGAVRRACLDGRTVRQRLLSHSDADRSYQYEFCGPPPLFLESYLATLCFWPVVASDQTFVEWRADFECAAERRESLRRELESLFAVWIASLSEVVRA